MAGSNGTQFLSGRKGAKEEKVTQIDDPLCHLFFFKNIFKKYLFIWVLVVALGLSCST